MAEKLYRWNGTQWVPVVDVTRLEVKNTSMSSIMIIHDVKIKSPTNTPVVYIIEPKLVVFGGIL